MVVALPLIQFSHHHNSFTKNLSKPHYQLKVQKLPGSDLSLEIWQLPSPATPHLKNPKRVAGIKGRNFALIEHRLLRQLKQININLTSLQRGKVKDFDLDEEQALKIGLMFRVLAPMRNRKICAVVLRELNLWAKKKLLIG